MLMYSPSNDLEPGVYKVEIAWDLFDPEAVDGYAGGPTFKGKFVQSGSWSIDTDNIEFAMEYSEAALMTCAMDDRSKPYRIARAIVTRNGLHLFELDHGSWVAIGDDPFELEQYEVGPTEPSPEYNCGTCSGTKELLLYNADMDGEWRPCPECCPLDFHDRLAT